MVLDHWVSQSSDNSYSIITQTVKGGRCVYEQKTCGHDTELDNAVETCQPAALPSKPQKMIINNAIRKIYTANRGIIGGRTELLSMCRVPVLRSYHTEPYHSVGYRHRVRTEYTGLFGSVLAIFGRVKKTRNRNITPLPKRRVPVWRSRYGGRTEPYRSVG